MRNRNHASQRGNGDIARGGESCDVSIQADNRQTYGQEPSIA